MLWILLGNFVPTQDRERYLTSFFHFLATLVDVAYARHRQQLIAAFNVILGTKTFVVKSSSDGERLDIFSGIPWMRVELHLFGSDVSKSLAETVANFLATVIENLPEIFHLLKPLVSTLVASTTSTRLSDSGKFVVDK